MNVRYEHRLTMTFIGFSTTIRPDEGYIRCPEFWDREYKQKYARLWRTMKPETTTEKAILENSIGMFAICDDRDDSFDYWIAGLYKGGAVPDGMKLFTFPESDWAMFSARGPLPGALQKLNAAVWREWYPDEGKRYTVSATATLEVYSTGDTQSPDYECGIWIPVRQTKDNSAEITATDTLLGIL